MTRERSRWELQAEIAVLAAIHAAIALALILAPRRVVVTATNVNVFRIMPDILDVHVTRILWGAAFFVCAGALLNLIWHHHLLAQMAATMSIGFVNGLWFASYTLPLAQDRGSAIGTIIFTALLAWPAFVIYRVAHGTGE